MNPAAMPRARAVIPSPALDATGTTASVLGDLDALAPFHASWDDLARTLNRPYCTPGWALPWATHVQPAGSDLRAVAVNEGADLVGFAPFSVARDHWGVTTWRGLGADVASYAEPLAVEHRRRQVAVALSAALSTDSRPVDVLSLSGVPHDSPWPRLLQETWPGPRPRLAVVNAMPAPFVDLPSGGFDEWFTGRSRNFRQQIRRRTREFLRRGGVFRRAETADELVADLAEFERLHAHRWAARGGSRALNAPVAAMLRQAGGVLGPDRMQVWTAEVDGRGAGSAVFVAAGDEVHYWLGGFDGTSADLSPSLLLLVEAVRHAAATGYRRLSLGPGARPYKSRLATGEDRLVWLDLLPVTRRYPWVRLRQAPRRLRRVAAERTPPELKERLRAVAIRRGGTARTATAPEAGSPDSDGEAGRP
jgi:CelD/BcsL family acetyltransferase involved in cellulose biosynthesis